MLLENQNAIVYGGGGLIGSAIALRAYVAAVADTAGSIDVAVNAVGIHGELQGTALSDISIEDYSVPIVKGTTTNLLTARTVAGHMVRQRSGTILLISATATWSKAALRQPLPMGGFGVACAAVEGLSRSLAAELGPHGVRVACLRLEGTADLFSILTAAGAGVGSIDATEMKALLESDSLLRRLPTAAEVGNVAALLASGRAAALTGVIANVSCGAVIT
jgi:3-oxoacyl-[acyl-carrier protein] reductase